MDSPKDSQETSSEICSLKEQIEKLKAELQNAEKAAKKNFSEGTAVKVIFSTEGIKRKYQTSIEIFLEKLLRDEKQGGISFEVVDKLETQTSDEINLDTDIFFENTSNVNTDGRSLQKFPVYDNSFEEPLGCDAISDQQVKKRKSNLVCFNCLGDHHLKTCPEERDGLRIANNRRELNNDTPTTSRYIDEIYEKGQPGTLSDELREALGLRRYQLPLYIYRMRILGYPPAWMKEAQIETSGLAVYDSNGKSFVDGEDPPHEKKQFNGKKFISYPGFNVPVPEGMKDEHVELLMPPLQIHQQLTEALKHERVTISPEYKKRKKGKMLQVTPKRKKDNKNDRDNKSGSSSAECISDSPSTPSPSIKKAPNSVHLGSPFVSLGNPVQKVPDFSKFAEGMSPFLPYENLPDAVGSFDKMKNVLDDVKQRMKSL